MTAGWARARLAVFALMAGCAAPVPPAPSTPPAPAPVLVGDVNVPTPALLELRAPELRGRFGEPHQARRDGGAEIWNYEASGLCRLNLVLQREHGSLKVVHAQARMAAGGSEDACLRALERRR